MQQSNIFIANKDLKHRFVREYDVSGLDEPNPFGIAATKAAYRFGDEWYEAVKVYIKSNIDFAKE